MRAAGLRALAAVVLVAALGTAVHLLREATQSTHYRTSPDSRLVVVVEARSNRAEPTQSLAELTAAHLSTCRLEVAADIDGAVEPVAGTDDRFRVVLSPALDSTDRKQFEGCVEDWYLDHLLARVVSMEDGGAP